MRKCTNPIAQKVTDSAKRTLDPMLKENGGPGFRGKRGETMLPLELVLDLISEATDQAVQLTLDFARDAYDVPR